MASELRIDCATGQTEEVEYAPPPAAVPAAVTMRQARLALLDAGLLDKVETALEALPGRDGQAAQISWEYSAEVHRQSELVTALAPALGVNGEQLDALFVAAAGL
jgi:hypothetical protein